MRDDDDIYDEEQVEEQLDNDEISPGEAGFMEGYDNPNLVKCKVCGKQIDPIDLEYCKEVVVDNKVTWICNSCCELEENEE